MAIALIKCMMQQCVRIRRFFPNIEFTGIQGTTRGFPNQTKSGYCRRKFLNWQSEKSKILYVGDSAIVM